MHNIIGRPARGDDFFDREPERRRIWRLLKTDHLLLLAPRRVGKTSLMYHLVTEAEAHDCAAAYVSVAGTSSELALVAQLYLKAAKQSAQVEKALLAGRLKGVFEGVRSLKLAGVEMVLRERPGEPWQLIGRELVQALRDTGQRWVLMVDELPVFILALLRQEGGLERVRAFLHWFREVRQGEPEQPDLLRWLLAGSIGLDAVARRLELGETINDLHILHLGAFDAPTADDFLERLERDNGLTLTPDVRAHAMERVGWLIPYHLQLLVSVLLDAEAPQPETAAVDAALSALLSPGRKSYFDTWVTRLSEELGQPSRDHALALLDACAEHPEGPLRDTLSQVLARHIHDDDERDRSLAWLLDVLQSDGYLVLAEGRYRFRSTLLRAFWVQRFQ